MILQCSTFCEWSCALQSAASASGEHRLVSSATDIGEQRVSKGRNPQIKIDVPYMHHFA